MRLQVAVKRRVCLFCCPLAGIASAPAPAPAPAACGFTTITVSNAADLRKLSQEFDALYRGRAPLLIRNACSTWPAYHLWNSTQHLVDRFGHRLQLPLRHPDAVARGSSFRTAGRFVSLHDWHGDGAGHGRVMVFDTNETSGIFPQLREDLMVPRALRNILRIPVFSLAAGTRDLSHPEGGSLGGGSGSSDDGRDSSGLALHTHDENWLALISGRKTWFTSTPSKDRSQPPLAYQRVPIASLRALAADGTLTQCTQEEGDIVYLPSGTWHATYSHTPAAGPLQGQQVVIGVGGMGQSTQSMALAVLGDVEALERLHKRDTKGTFLSSTNKFGEQAVHHAADVATLRWLIEQGGVDVNQGTTRTGITPMHRAAIQGSVDGLQYLSSANGDIHAPAANGVCVCVCVPRALTCCCPCPFGSSVADVFSRMLVTLLPRRSCACCLFRTSPRRAQSVFCP